MQKFVLPAPGDWSVWYFIKQLIAREEDANNPFLSLIPEQGQFHVSLNLHGDIVNNFRPFFHKLYTDLFGRPLPEKPKPYQCTLCVLVAFLAWLQIRSLVMRKFKSCKDIEYIYFLYLLEELVPLAFYQYEIVFKSGNIEKYREVMYRLAIIFISMKRHHYNKSTLSWLSDDDWHTTNFPLYTTLKENHLPLVCERKVEVWHSLLRERE